MQRPICIVAIGSILGIIMGLYLNGIAHFLYAILGICIFITVLFNKRANSYNLSKDISKIILISLCSTLVFFIYTNHLENTYNQIYRAYDAQEIKIQAQIISAPKEKEYKYIYEIKIEKINGKKVKTTKFLLNVKKEKEIEMLEYGDKISLTSTYEKPQVATNTGGFDYSNYLKTKKISGIISSKTSEIKVIAKSSKLSIGNGINNLKTQIQYNLNKVLNSEMARASSRIDYRGNTKYK